MSKPVVQPVRSHFLDSGAFSLRRKGQVDYRAYMDRYAAFIRENSAGIDYYANVDVIGDPQQTWEHQQYLEKEHGLKPVPVVHFGTDMKWLEKLLDKGYRFIALGGLVGKGTTTRKWISSCFQVAGGARLHGFGITNWLLVTSFPWWSVDSAAWKQEALKWGAVFVPTRFKGKYCFSRPPLMLLTADSVFQSKKWREGNRGRWTVHYKQLSELEQNLVNEWLGAGGVLLNGLADKQGTERCKANLYYFDSLSKASRVRFYFSGGGTINSFDSPEVYLKKARIMMTFYEMPCKRFDRILAARLAKGRTRPFPASGEESV